MTEKIESIYTGATMTTTTKKKPLRCSVCNLFTKKERLLEKSWRGISHYICLTCERRRRMMRRRIENNILWVIVCLCTLSIIRSLFELYGK